MADNVDNVVRWADADVFVTEDLDAELPASAEDPMGVEWSESVGLLDGDDGFTESRSWGVNDDKFAWGNKLVDTIYGKYVETHRFVALEANAVTYGLLNPGSTGGTLVIPRPKKLKICFETRSGGKVYRRACAGYVRVTLDSSRKRGESDIDRIPFIAKVYPTNDEELWFEQSTPEIASLAISPLTLALDLSDAQIKKLVATATYDDASMGDVSDQAVWTTSDAAKATVSHGYVTPHATGTANISCAYGGVTATAPCAVTVSA